MRTSLPPPRRDRPCVLWPGEAAAESRPSRPFWEEREQLLGPARRWSPQVARRSTPETREQMKRSRSTPETREQMKRSRTPQPERDAERDAERGIYVGIDVAQAALDVAVRPSGPSWRSGNDEAGRAEIVARRRPLAPALIVLEATGGYERLLVAALALAELPVAVAVVNPRHVRRFAQATGQLAKTDALDARVLAHFADAVR